MYDEDYFIPLSALQHWTYCPRQCGLIHIDREWTENRFTAEGAVLHDRVHSGVGETKAGVRFARSLPVRSSELGIVGQCDLVEFHANGRVIPIEYKRGKRKSHAGDNIQLAGQAMCLEEMLGIEVSTGYLFYGRSRRREEVTIDHGLRQLVRQTAASVRIAIDSRRIPSALYDRRRCDTCSMLSICQPRAFTHCSADDWFRSMVNDAIE